MNQSFMSVRTMNRHIEMTGFLASCRLPSFLSIGSDNPICQGSPYLVARKRIALAQLSARLDSRVLEEASPVVGPDHFHLVVSDAVVLVV